MELNWAQLHKDSTTTLEGDFPVVISEATSTVSSTGKPMIKVVLKIESGQYAGRKLFSQFVVSAESPGAMRMFFGHMDVLGLNQVFFAKNPTMDDVAAALVNRRATVVLKTRQWQGTDRESVEGWKPALGGPGGGTGGTLGGLVASPPAGPLATAAAAQQPPLGNLPTTAAPADPFTQEEEPPF